MGVEKEGSKNGSYVGGFFQLFDWTAKSRKKLFSSKSDLPVRSKQGKRSNGNLPMTRLHLMDEDETGAGSSIRGSSDYSCASSVTDDDGCGARAPGVVARLMGLDSLPTSSSDPNATPFLDTQSLMEASQRRKHSEYYNDPQIMYSGNLVKKEDGCPLNFLDSKPQVLSRPIEKFQTEILPPKSAKSIPITHHKLLSPIKGPGFVPSKTAAHIMEAAARIIEPSPQATKSRVSIGSSSVPLKVRDLKEKLEVAQKTPLVGSSAASLKARNLKEKMEAPNKTSRLAEPSTRRPVESNAAKYLKGQSLNKSWNNSVETKSIRAFPETEEGSGLKNKGKSVSLAIQAKVNVQKRESMNSGGNRGLVGHGDHCEVMSSQTFTSQPNSHRRFPKNSTGHVASGVLRQNNQKQNGHIDKDKPSKPAVGSHLQGRKALTGNSSSVPYNTPAKTVRSKTGTRKLGSDAMDSEMGLSNYSTKHIPRKKRSIDRNLHLEKNHAVDNKLIDKNQKEIESNRTIDRHFNCAEDSKSKGMDVVSFTFTAPLRYMPDYETSGQLKKSGSFCMDKRSKRLLLDTDSIKSSSVGYNVIGGDALSALLEQKLRELTNSMESSRHNSGKIGSTLSSPSFLQDLAPTINSGSTTPRLHNNTDQNLLLVGKLSSSCDSDVFSTDPMALRSKQMFQGIDELEECSSKSDDSRNLLDRRRPSPVSVLETFFSTESSSSLDSTECSSAEGRKPCSSIQAQEILGSSFSNKFHYVDADTDLSDSASSKSAGTTAWKHANTLPVMNLVKSTKWEIEYVQKILFNLEFTFQEFAPGWAREITSPLLFNQLESQKGGLVSDGVEARLERKVFFDCVNECLDKRCRHYVGGGYKAWTKGVTMVRRKDRLAEEVLKEISAWKDMGDCMVDELVDKDMSSQHGRWLDFEVDASILGMDIEGQIYSSLLDEVVADVFQS